jgi:hypothetical protein
MPPTVAAFWKKLNKNETMVMYGAIIVVIAFIVGLVGSSGFGTASTDLVAAVVIAVIYWLKYSPSNINWPVPVQTIVVVIAGIAALFALIAALGALAFLFSFGLYGIGLLINAVGCVIMAYFAWKEYQAMPKAAAPPPPAPPAPPAA